MAAPASKTCAPPSAPSSTSATSAEEVDTLGGYLVTKAGHVPVRGELVAGPNTFETEVLDADPRRVKKVRIYRHARTAGRRSVRRPRRR